MTTHVSYSSLESRPQGYAESLLSSVKFPFRLKQLAPKRCHLCTISWEFIGCHLTVRLDIAPPVRGRPWWTIWSFTHEDSFDGPRHTYHSQASAFLSADLDDQLETVGQFLLIKCADKFSMDFQEIIPGELSAYQIRAAQCSTSIGLDRSHRSWSPDIKKGDYESIVAAAFPDMQDKVAGQLREYFESL